MTSELLDKQLVAAQLLSRFARTSASRPHELFEAWADQTELGSFVIGRSIHIEALERFEPALIRLMKPALLSGFWRLTMNSHISLRGKMLSIIAKSIRELPESDAMTFLNSVSDVNDVEVVQFLAEVAENTEAIARQIAVKVFDMACQPELQPKSGPVLAILARISVATRDIFRRCFKRLLEPESQKFVVHALSIFIQNANQFPAQPLREAIPQALAVQGAHMDLLFGRYSRVQNRTNQPVTLPMLRTFIDAGAVDALWAMLSGLLDALGTVAIQDDGIELLISLAHSQDLTLMSNPFVYFLKSFVLMLNTRAEVTRRNARSGSTFSLVRLPIVEFELVVKALIMADVTRVSEQFKQFMLQLLRVTDSLSNEDLVKYILESLKPGLEGGARHKQRCLDFLFTYVKEYERFYRIQEFGAIRHSDKSETDPTTSVTIANHFRKPLFNLKVALNGTPKPLKVRVANRLERDVNSFALMFQGRDICDSRSLHEADVKN
jgi:hypothetical protein